MEKKYKVTSPKDLYLCWNKSLLSVENLKKWEDYKENVLKKETSDEKKLKIFQTPESILLREWCSAMNFGRDDVADRFQSGEIESVPLNHKPEYKFFIKANEEHEINERQYKELLKYERRALVHELKPGEKTPKISYEGFLTFEEVEPKK